MLHTNHPMGPPGLQPAHARSARGSPNARSNTVAGLLLIALAAYGVARFEHEPIHEHHAGGAFSASGTTPLAAPFTRAIDLDSSCDGRATCSQTTACTEAKAFLQSCPGVPLDRDGNGAPCDKTWCGSPLAN